MNMEEYISLCKNCFDKSLYNFFILDDFLFPFMLKSIFTSISFVGYFGFLTVIFLKLRNKIGLNMKKYRMKILENKDVEETLFFVFVKNLPKLTDKADLKQFLEQEYKVSIREIMMLNDYSVLESLRRNCKPSRKQGSTPYLISRQ